MIFFACGGFLQDETNSLITLVNNIQEFRKSFRRNKMTLSAARKFSNICFATIDTQETPHCIWFAKPSTP